MPDYLYRGRDPSGELKQGSLQATDTVEAARWLLANGITPTGIEPRKAMDLAGKAGRFWSARVHAASEQDLLLFTRQMRALVRAGVPLTQALASLEASTQHAGLAAAVANLQAQLEKGSTLSQTMSLHPGIFNDYYVSMIKIGESTGLLEESFARLFEQLQMDFEMRQKIRAALRYPSFVLLAITAAIAIVTTFVIPTFATLFAGMNMELPPLTRFLLGLSSLTTHYGWLLLAIGVGCGYGIRWLLKRPSGRLRWDQIKLRLPVVGSIIRKASLVRFCRSLATALASGVPVVEAFSIVARVVDNAHYEQRILGMRAGIERGESMLRVARSAGIFSPITLQMIAVGEQTGDLDGLLEQVADIHREEVEYEASRLSAAIEPLLLLALGALVGMLLFGVFEPMWNMTQMTRRH